MKMAFMVLNADIVDLFGIVIDQISRSLGRQQLCGEKQKIDGKAAPDFMYEIKFSATRKLTVWMERLFILAGFVEDDDGVFKPQRPDAITRLFGLHTTRSYGNGLVRPAFFTKDEIDRANESLSEGSQIDCNIINPFEVSDSALYFGLAEKELGDKAYDPRCGCAVEDRKMYPHYILRHAIISEWLNYGKGHPDPRLKSITAVEPTQHLSIHKKTITSKPYGGIAIESGTEYSLRYAIQRTYRQTVNRRAMSPLFVSLLK